MTCCEKIKLENFNYYNGIYILDPATRVYKQEDGDQILHQRKNGWYVGKKTDGPSYQRNPVGFCINYI